MKFVDYYKILGVAASATPDEIKKAYRRLARKFHPDVSKEADAEERFKELGEAYEVLKDPDKRAEYDNLRKHGVFHGDDFTPPPDWHSRAGFGGGGFTAADARQFSDFFEQIFGGAGRSGRGAGFAMRGEDLHYRLAVSLEEAYAGGTRTVELKTHRLDARGRALPDKRMLKVKVPRGVVHGQQIRLRGQGSPGAGGAPAGDLYLQIEIKPHPHFAVTGHDITVVLPVAPWEAALGASVEVPTLGGAVRLAVPANARAGQKFRLKGRGLPGKPPGDEYAILQIVMPEVRSDADRQLMETMARQMAFDPRRPREN